MPRSPLFLGAIVALTAYPNRIPPEAAHKFEDTIDPFGIFAHSTAVENCQKEVESLRFGAES